MKLHRDPVVENVLPTRVLEAPEEIRTLRPEELQEATKDSEACGMNG